MDFLKYGIGIIAFGILLALLFSWLPVSLSIYPLATFGADLDNLGSALTKAFSFFASFFDVVLLLTVIKAIFWLLLIGFSIKIIFWVYNVITGGGI